MKATKKQKKFLDKLVKELETLKEGDTNHSYNYANLDKFATCDLHMLTNKQGLKLSEALHSILKIVKDLK